MPTKAPKKPPKPDYLKRKLCGCRAEARRRNRRRKSRPDTDGECQIVSK